MLAGVAAWSRPRGRSVPLGSAVVASALTDRATRIALIAKSAAAAPLGKSRWARILKSSLTIGLADCELGNRPRRRLRIHARKAGADQRPVQPDLLLCRIHRVRQGIARRRAVSIGRRGF